MPKDGGRIQPLRKAYKPLYKCRVLSPHKAILSAMPVSKSFFTKSLSQILTVIRLMASPEGTTLSELTKRLSLTRRSVFHLLRRIETDLHIPVIVTRKGFGGHAKYVLPKSFIERLSQSSLPRIKLTFDEALTIYLLSIPGSLPKEGNYRQFRFLQDTSGSFKKQRGKEQWRTSC